MRLTHRTTLAFPASSFRLLDAEPSQLPSHVPSHWPTVMSVPVNAIDSKSPGTVRAVDADSHATIQAELRVSILQTVWNRLQQR